MTTHAHYEVCEFILFMERLLVNAGESPGHGDAKSLKWDFVRMHIVSEETYNTESIQVACLEIQPLPSEPKKRVPH